ncbi:Mur ligase family protein [bacterium]|nr:Mur ligase family protein [bacterium]
MRKIIAIAISKLFTSLLRATGRGGTALPGLLAERIHPSLLAELASRFSQGTILITGTNGKTTTASLVANVLRAKGYKVIHNFTGSNLTRGILGQILEDVDLKGNFSADFGVLEVDEATSEKAAQLLKPRIMLVTNLFRDQLDRYGELDKVASIIDSSLKWVKERVILNGDDPLVASLGSELKIGKIFFGLNAPELSLSRGVIDLSHCPICDAELSFRTRYYGHLGDYVCPNCHYKRPQLDLFALDVSLREDFLLDFKVNHRGEVKNVISPLFGIFNVYNILSALSLCQSLGLETDFILETIARTSPAFGRLEKFCLDSKECIIFLAKNPVGFSINIETVKRDTRKKNYLIILNDNLADGTDTSWIWDVDFEILKDDQFGFIICSGIRAEDMALRLKYADLPLEKIEIKNDIREAFQMAIKMTSAGERLYILPNYTAMLSLRSYLSKEGFLQEFWIRQ